MNLTHIFLINLIFIVGINILGGWEALLCTLLFVMFIYIREKNMKQVMILMGILLILSSNFHFRTIESIEKNRNYNLEIEITSDRGKIIKIENKYSKINYFPILDKSLEDGRYEIKGNILDIEDSLVEIEVLEETFLKAPVKRKLNEKIEEMTKTFPYEFQDFTKAVLLGRKDVISNEVREKFNYTGTSHLLVISGLHIGIIILTILFLLKNLPYQMRYSLSGVILTAYCYGVGFTPSVMRAYIMGMIFLGAKIFYEEREMKKALIISFIISSFINPYAMRSISYQMSYLALIGILFLYPKIKEYITIPKKYNKYKILDFLILSFSIQIILTPIFLYYFRVWPLFSFIPNLVAIPLGSVIVQLLFIGLLLSFIGIAGFVTPASYLLYKLLMFIIDFFYKVPFLTLILYNKIYLLIYVFLYAIILLFIILKKEKINKYWYIFFIIIPLIYMGTPQRSGKLDLKWAKYRMDESKILIINRDLDRREILELKDYGIKNLDYIVIPRFYPLKEIKKAYFEDIEIIILLEGEGIKVDGEIFINNGGKIEVEKSN